MNIRAIPKYALLVVCCFFLSFSARPSFADRQSDAQNLYVQGSAQYSAGEFNKAIQSFAAADRVMPAALLDYNIALCYEELKNYSEALRFYRSYLKRDPQADNKSDVLASIAKLEGMMLTPIAPSPYTAPKVQSAAPTQNADVISMEPVPAPSTQSAPAQKASAPTKSASMQRAESINVAQLRDEYRGMEPAQTSTNGVEAGAPAPQAESALSAGQYNQPTQQPLPSEPKAKDKPIYKKWFFWVVVGVAAVVLYDISKDDSNSGTTSTPRGLLLDQGAPQRGTQYSPGGATLLTF